MLSCPKCGSSSCQPVVETNTTGKDFSPTKGCLGIILFSSPLGLLCGLCGEGRKTNSTTFWMCHNCGSKFKA